MKKIILTAMMVLFIGSLSAQHYELKAKTLFMKDPYGRIYEYDTNLYITLNTSTQRCVIYSQETQIIDYEQIRTYVDKDGYRVMEAVATDTKYKRIHFSILVSTRTAHVIINISYSDYHYTYSCEFL